MVASNSKAHLVLSKKRKKCLLLTFHNLLSHDTRHYRIILLHHQNSFKTASCAQDVVVGGIWKATTNKKNAHASVCAGFQKRAYFMAWHYCDNKERGEISLWTLLWPISIVYNYFQCLGLLDKNDWVVPAHEVVTFFV